MLPPALAALAAVLLLASLEIAALARCGLKPRNIEIRRRCMWPFIRTRCEGTSRNCPFCNNISASIFRRRLPQFKWLPGLLMAGAVFGFAASLLRIPARRRALIFVSGALAVALALAAVQAMFQIHDIGHRRDQKTVLVGVKDFTPPFIGTNKIAQFTVSSRLGLGAWLIGGALALQLGAAWSSRQRQANTGSLKTSPAQNMARLTPATSHSS